VKLGDLAKQLDLQLYGDDKATVQSLAPVSRATKDDICFVVSNKYLTELKACRAGAIIVPEELLAHVPGNALQSLNPYASYARASWILQPETRPAAGVHHTAVIDPSSTIDASASIAANVVIGKNVDIGSDVLVGEHCVIGDNVSIGSGCRLFARVTIYHGCRLGQHCRLQSGSVVGSEGFGYAFDNGWQAIHQVGGVQVGDHVHIGANTTIDRGAMDDTVIGNGVILDNQIQIAHNVRIGDNTAIAGCVGIAGSTHIGSHCQIGGACNIVGHLKIADQVVLSATSFVSQSIKAPGRYSSGVPLQESHRWRRSFAAMTRIDELLKRVRKIERQLK